jgi:ribosome-associated protein
LHRDIRGGYNLRRTWKPLKSIRRIGGRELESNELARKVVDIAADRKAEDIVMLDISKVSIIADYFVICNGTSDRQVRAIAKEIDEKLGDAGVNPISIEGMNDAKWVLMDYGSVLVHVFDPATREFYRLEQLWAGAQPVLVVQ